MDPAGKPGRAKMRIIFALLDCIKIKPAMHAILAAKLISGLTANRFYSRHFPEIEFKRFSMG